MMNNLHENLESLVQWHGERGHRIAGLLRPGSAPEAVVRRLAAEGMAASPDLVALYSWRDGADDGYPFLLYHEFLPLDQALETRRELREILGGAFKQSWLPVFAFEGEYFHLDCGATWERPAPIRFHLLEDPDIRPAFTDLSHMIQTCLEGYRQGFVESSEEGFAIDLDMKVVARIHARMNPGLEFPWSVP